MTTTQTKKNKDWSGHTYELITIQSFYGKENNHLYWNAICKCGNAFRIRTDQLPDKVKSCGCICKLEKGQAALNKVYGHYKRSAKSRGYLFELTLAQFETLISKPCYYCGSLPSQKRKTDRMNGGIIYNGIDRNNNNIGYVYENCVSCCGFCNRAKFNKTTEEFEEWIQRLLDYRK